ncbi:MAG TPA: hypothetical protein VHS96_05230, partial [Bacteroidia bacterium]|nr:hypothetical protein [Bacteroidia bacterium]
MKKVLIQICGIALLSILQGQALPDSMLLAGRKAYLEGDYGVAIEVYREYYRQAQAAGDQRA